MCAIPEWDNFVLGVLRYCNRIAMPEPMNVISLINANAPGGYPDAFIKCSFCYIRLSWREEPAPESIWAKRRISPSYRGDLLFEVGYGLLKFTF